MQDLLFKLDLLFLPWGLILNDSENTRKRKYPNSWRVYLMCFVSTLEKHISEILMHALQRKKNDVCVSLIILFMPSFQSNGNLQSFLSNISDLELEMELFLPRTSQMCYASKGVAQFGEHQSSAMATIYLHFLLDAGCLCTFSLCVAPLCYQWFLASLPIEIITSKSNGKSSVSS